MFWAIWQGIKLKSKTKKSADLTKVIDQITKKVVDQISPKIDAIFDKVYKKFEVEIKEIRKTIETLQLPTPVTDPIKSQPSSKQGGLGDRLEEMLGSLGVGGQPLASAPQPLDQNLPIQQQQGSPMQILELIKLWKMIDSGDGSLGGISPKMMQEINMRQQIAMTNMTNQLFQQVTRDMMKRIGASPERISEMDLTNEHLMGKVAHLGSANKKEEMKDKIMEMAKNFKHKES